MGPRRQRLVNVSTFLTGWGACLFSGVIPIVVKHGKGKRDLLKPVCIVSNHVSWMDGLVHAALFQPSFVVKASILKWPFFRWAAITQPTVVNRSSGGRSTTELVESINARINKPSMPPITVFAEGTTTNGLGMIEFKAGAFVAGKPVQPVVLHYTNKVSIAWDTCSAQYVFFRTLTQLVSIVKVHILEPYEPDSDEKANPQLFAENVRRYMAEETGLLLFQSRCRHKIAYERWIKLGKKERTSAMLDEMLEAAMSEDLSV